ncbi:uncharacterized protein LOC127243635 isoform X2 [Andrographis paniculata]|uniref:uncharacterized protein LOC127243635 isoform X2 n=1 Tax=Andrographis paniculata TaxID=175694 RepID=UPI0021E7C29B|nr:uncharacterized protein LOC127243635 isoform X2 [Andrographis paniculata]
MDENDGTSEPRGPLPNGLLPGAGPVMQPLDTERWMKAEERTAEIIACIQPNPLSEGRRNAVADYVQRLIMKCFPSQGLKDSWANQVRDMLENEEKNKNAEFRVKEVQYIQAEVKIIKCLVENIVVDISFNQVGGLCTLCFLDEVDNLINQNHLFKRSIILIKAWCYYESRILGAHHGLISTYALETLVLYIFHVFNNSFHGPLEVLYRFLEFFSNFDWDNFCVSLWGPVPIISLPDVSAEPPRKDRGDLLLSKLFLDACSSVYAVFPGGQESNGQQFVSKHFNVIDPLRVNNNLGRSVSKGNFFRIRSAFTFGAKKLARLLDCPKEALTFEVNQFFLNTWERHGSGHRPDAPLVDSHLRLQITESSPGFGNSNNHTSGKTVKENPSHDMEGKGINARGVSSQQGRNWSRTIPVTNDLPATSHMQGLKSRFNLKSLRFTEKIGRDAQFGHTVVNENTHRSSRLDPLVNDSPGRLHFARTQSNPDLTDNFCDESSHAQCDRQAEIVEVPVSCTRPDSISMRKNVESESMASHSNYSSVEDTSWYGGVSSPKSHDAADSHSISIRPLQDMSADAFNEELLASSGQSTQKEEQDIVNMMSSASLQGMTGHINVPINLASSHLPYSIPPSFAASMGYTQPKTPGFVPTSIPLVDSSFSNVQFPHSMVPQQLTRYFPGFELHTSKDSVEPNNENFGPVGSSGFHGQGIGSSVGYDLERKFETLQLDDTPPASMSGLKYVPPPARVSSSGSSAIFQQQYPGEKHGRALESIDNFIVQDIRSNEVYLEERSTSSRLSSVTHGNSLRSRTLSESSWDGSSVKVHKSMKEKRGKRIVSFDLAANRGKGKAVSEHVSNDTEDDDKEWGSSSNVGTGMIEMNPFSDPINRLQIPRHGISGFEVAQTSESGSMIPFAPMFIGPGSRQGTNDNSGVIAFYPTGPPIPFLTMLHVCNIPSETSPDASCNQFGGDETLVNESGTNFSPKKFDHPGNLNSLSSIRGNINMKTSEERKPDILNSDFSSHWQNLQFGRFCQNPRYQGPLLYPSPVMVPPVYVQGRIPFDNFGRGLPSNSNIVSQIMASYGHQLPVSPLQSVPSRNSNVYQSFMDEMPRYRGGTGTYLPNPKVSVRERHSSGNRRGYYTHDRTDSLGDREGNWSISKPRSAARSRSQTDKMNSRTEGSAHSEVRGDHSWSSQGQNSIPSSQSQNGSLHSSSSQNNPRSVAHMYSLAVANPGGVPNGSAPPIVMLYPFGHNAAYVFHSDQLEFGSLGPLGFQGVNPQLQLHDGTQTRAFEHHRSHGNFGHRTSRDQPSSPRPERKAR